MAGSLIVHVQVQVRPGAEDAFRSASLANVAASRREPGILRFELLADRDDPHRFLLIEVYRDAAAAAAHKETAHYAAWRDAVAELMAEPRRSVKYLELTPETAGG